MRGDIGGETGVDCGDDDDGEEEEGGRKEEKKDMLCERGRRGDVRVSLGWFGEGGGNGDEGEDEDEGDKHVFRKFREGEEECEMGMVGIRGMSSLISVYSAPSYSILNVFSLSLWFSSGLIAPTAFLVVTAMTDPSWCWEAISLCITGMLIGGGGSVGIVSSVLFLC